MHKKNLLMKVSTFLSLVVLFVLFFSNTTVIWAATTVTPSPITNGEVGDTSVSTRDQYTTITDMSGFSKTTNGSLNINTASLGDFLGMIFKFGIWISSVLAVIMIFYGGFRYVTEEAISGKKVAWKTIENALYGIALVWSSYLILYTVNPELVSLRITQTVMSDEELASFKSLVTTYNSKQQALIAAYNEARADVSAKVGESVNAGQKLQAAKDKLDTLQRDFDAAEAMNRQDLMGPLYMQIQETKSEIEAATADAALARMRALESIAKRDAANITSGVKTGQDSLIFGATSDMVTVGGYAKPATLDTKVQLAIANYKTNIDAVKSISDGTTEAAKASSGYTTEAPVLDTIAQAEIYGAAIESGTVSRNYYSDSANWVNFSGYAMSNGFQNSINTYQQQLDPLLNQLKTYSSDASLSPDIQQQARTTYTNLLQIRQNGLAPVTSE